MLIIFNLKLFKEKVISGTTVRCSLYCPSLVIILILFKIKWFKFNWFRDQKINLKTSFSLKCLFCVFKEISRPICKSANSVYSLTCNSFLIARFDTSFLQNTFTSIRHHISSCLERIFESLCLHLIILVPSPIFCKYLAVIVLTACTLKIYYCKV